jgi:NAD(P)-dependent dehydrogenase (short-subunit alcohol dehydrogenase family)
MGKVRMSRPRKMFGPYATSKLALSLWTQAVAPQLAKEDIKIRSVDSGINNTLRKGKDSGLTVWFELFMKFFPFRLPMAPTYYMREPSANIAMRPACFC